MPSNPVARRNHDQLFGDRASTLSQTDPSPSNFAFVEVSEHGLLGARTKLLVLLAGLIGAQALTEYRDGACGHPPGFRVDAV